ncbi:hypothetical protein AAC387_Pa06g1350 [Persea americana]
MPEVGRGGKDVEGVREMEMACTGKWDGGAGEMEMGGDLRLGRDGGCEMDGLERWGRFFKCEICTDGGLHLG